MGGTTGGPGGTSPSATGGQGGSTATGTETTIPPGTGGIVVSEGGAAGGTTTPPIGSGGRPGTDGGPPGTGGRPPQDGGRDRGTTPGDGGSPGDGGTPGRGGAPGTGGGPVSGGAPGSGGRPGTGGAPGSGGSPGTGGTTVINPGQCNATNTPVARHGKLRIENGKLVNQCGRPVSFTSMSMYDWSQQGRQFYNATAVRNLFTDKKCTSLRIPLLARNYPSQYGRMKTVMDACVATGIYCIPNWHVIGNSNVTNARAMYVQLAREYGNTPNIIYEPWNEPTSQSWSGVIKPYMEDILRAVRAIDPDNVFLAGTRQWCQQPGEACSSPINDPNVGYVFHFYAASHSITSFRRSVDTCLTARKLVWTTEYGGCSANGNGAVNVSSVNAWWAYMDQNLISSNAWAIETNGETSSVFTGRANANGPWQDSEITNWGRLVFAQIAERYPVTMSQ